MPPTTSIFSHFKKKGMQPMTTSSTKYCFIKPGATHNLDQKSFSPNPIRTFEKVGKLIFYQIAMAGEVGSPRTFRCSLIYSLLYQRHNHLDYYVPLEGQTSDSVQNCGLSSFPMRYTWSKLKVLVQHLCGHRPKTKELLELFLLLSFTIWFISSLKEI